ncbi:chemerin-like receptor 1 [Gastrophryne carolinensis]
MSWQHLCYSNKEIEELLEFYVKYYDAVRHFSFALSMFTSVVGLIGNAIVIFFTIFVTKNHESKIWFLNLAVTDFVSLLMLPLHGLSASHGQWFYGEHICKLFLFLMCVNGYGSIFILIALNISRVLSVAKPMFYLKFMSRHVTCWTCTVIWIITILANVPVLHFGGEVQIGKDRYCSLFSDKDFNGGLSALGYNISENITSQAQNLIYQKFGHIFKECSSEVCCGDEDALAFWNHMAFSLQCFATPLLLIGYFFPLCVITFSNITIALQARKSPTVDTTRLYRIVITIIVIYFVTWTPMIIAQIIQLSAINNMNAVLLFKVIFIMPCLCVTVYTNASLNPIMYVLVGRKTRTGLAYFFSSARSSVKSDMQ